jgi:hypothetical protein
MVILGFHAKSLMEKEAMKHFYTFLIFNVLVVSTMGGTVFETFLDFISAPDVLIHSVAQVRTLPRTQYSTLFLLLTASSIQQALPRQSLYFTNYTMFAITGNFIFGFLRLYPMALRHFKRRRVTTPNEVRALLQR